MKSLKSELFPESSYEKRKAAEICHSYLTNVVREPDESNISPAFALKDIFDCHTCVMHIAQVYLKGIILPSSDDVFGNGDILTAGELTEIAERLVSPEKRLKPSISLRTPAAIKLTSKDLAAFDRFCLYDVRTEREYKKGHPEGALNLPLTRIALNPYVLGEDKYANLVFTCETGATAAAAAEYALGAGYKNVFILS